MTPAELRAKGFRLVRNGNLRPFWSRELVNEVVPAYALDPVTERERRRAYQREWHHKRKERS